MVRTTLTIITVLLATLYQLHFRPLLKFLGLGHVVRERECILITQQFVDEYLYG